MCKFQRYVRVISYKSEWKNIVKYLGIMWASKFCVCCLQVTLVVDFTMEIANAINVSYFSSLKKVFKHLPSYHCLKINLCNTLNAFKHFLSVSTISLSLLIFVRLLIKHFIIILKYNFLLNFIKYSKRID